MASQVPAVKGTAFTLYFTLYKSDGTVIANPGTYTKKISKDGGAVADCANSVTEIDTTYGALSLVLSTSEMNADAVWVQIKDDTTGCVPFVTTIYTSAQTLDAIHDHASAADATVNHADYGNAKLVRSTTPANTLDVASTGEAGLDFANIKAAASPTTLTNITVPTVTAVTNDAAKYMHGAVWVDTVNGAAGTTSYVNGIATNPCSTIASAKTIADNLKLKRFWIQAGSAVTLGAAYAGYIFDGRGYSLDLGTRDISKSQFERCEGLTGTGTCATGEAVIYDSHLAAISIGEADFTRCHLNGVVTLTQASVPYLFRECVGVGTLGGITFAAAGQAAVVSNWGGYLTVAGMVAGNTLYLDGDGEVVFAASCTGGTVYVAGNMTLVNNGSDLAITQTARFDTAQLPTPLDAAGVRTAVGLSLANLDTQLDALPTAAENAAAVLMVPANKLATDESGHVDSFGCGYKTMQGGVFVFMGDTLPATATDTFYWSEDGGAMEGSLIYTGNFGVYTIIDYDTVTGNITVDRTLDAKDLSQSWIILPAAPSGSTGSVMVAGYEEGMSPAEQVLVTPAQPIATTLDGYVTASNTFPNIGEDGNVVVGGYASGQDPASLLLATPANKLATDENGYVTSTNGGSGASLAEIEGSLVLAKVSDIPAAADIADEVCDSADRTLKLNKVRVLNTDGYDPAAVLIESTVGNGMEVLAEANAISLRGGSHEAGYGDVEFQRGENVSNYTGSSVFVPVTSGVTVGGYDTGMSPAEQLDISGLSTFDPATDTVARVTLVDTTTDLTNTGGGGATAKQVWEYSARALTDKAGFAPSAADIATAVWGAATRSLTTFGSLASSVAAAVWGATTRTLSAFGFTVALTSAYDHAKDDTLTAVQALNDFDPASDTVARVTLVDTTTTLTNAPDVTAALTSYGTATATDVSEAKSDILADTAIIKKHRVNKRVTTDTTDIVYDDDDTTPILSQTLTITATDATRGKSSV